MSNPLLDLSGLPRFNDIAAEHMLPAIQQVIADNRTAIQTLTQMTEIPTWHNFVQPLEALDNRLGRVWSPIGHMNAVVNSEAIRDAYNQCLPLLSEYSTELGQNKALFEKYQQIANSDAFAQLNKAQQKVINNTLRDFKLSGIDLAPEQQKRYGEIRQQLSDLASKFDAHVLDATQGWHKHITDIEQLAGMPESALAAAQQAAQAKQLDGYLITLNFPSYLPVMTYCSNRALRQEVYTAFCTRASDQGTNPEWDNTQLIQQTLQLRGELAELLGFDSYAAYSLATKMAETPDQVMQFLNDLAERSKPIAEKELIALRAFAQQQYDVETLEAWDISYYSEKLREHQYAINDEQLRPYFPEDKVLQGMFAVVNRLYGIQIRENNQVALWHQDARYFEVYNADGTQIAGFFLDLYARQHKRGGAWMDDCQMRYRDAQGQLQLPIAYLTCNFNSPVGDQPALFTHDEVITLFHEFGHGLHHMLTEIDVYDVAGINGVAWDAVELPSQFLENWCWEAEALDLISGHYQTGEPLPSDLLDKMKAAKNFQSAMMMVRQLEFSLFDFSLHLQTTASTVPDVQQTLNQIRQQVSVLIPPSFNRFQHSFSHIFAGGYAAGYYSYKWAEVLSSDAFSRFEEEGIFNQETGLSFLKEVLSQGGSAEPMQLFINFRGREPSIEPLLRHSGILEETSL